MKQQQRDTPYPLRMSPELRKTLETAAQAAGRSLNQHILMILQASADSSGETPATKAELAELRAELEELKSVVEKLREKNKR